MKRCSKCGIDKPMQAFAKQKASGDGRYRWCRECARAYHGSKRQNVQRIQGFRFCHGCGKEKFICEFNKRASRCKPCQKSWREANRDTLQLRKQRRRDSGATKDEKLRRQYGITLAQYNAMLAEQGGLCAICNKPSRMKRPLAVDHDHVTGRIRGLLCFHCNTAIGHLLDDPKLVQIAADYLGRHAPKPLTFIA